jgi:hypothetical protein
LLTLESILVLFVADADHFVDPGMLDHQSLLNLIEEGVGPEYDEAEVGHKDHEK